MQSALLKDYVLKVIHTNRTFRLPEFTGTLKSGTVDWETAVRRDIRQVSDTITEPGRRLL